MNTRSASRIPEHWIARIFAKMSATYGEAFAKMWADVEPAMMKETWAQGLHGQTEEALKRGLAGLFHEKYPPNLPRFIELCHAQSAMYATSAITHEHRITEDGDASLANVRTMLAKHSLPKSEVPANMTGIEWAAKIIREANESRGAIDLLRLKHAQESLQAWCALHHCGVDDLDEFGKWKHGSRYASSTVDQVQLPPLVASPHIYREPGDDDE